MRCQNPFSRSYDYNGNIRSLQESDKEFVPFGFGCRKCLPCRLQQAREKSIRCWHESKLHEHNIFLTLTYSDQHLASPRLIYSDWQTFIKALRHHIYEKELEKIFPEIATHMERRQAAKALSPDARKILLKRIAIRTIQTGEYGEHNKRPHWHAIIFNYAPGDSKYHRTTERGDTLYSSSTLDQLWGNNDPENCPTLFGAVTIESAGYVARYAAKKLVHGRDQDHDYHPLHKTSSKRAIGRGWIEKNWRHVFATGFINLPTGIAAIPRYYTDWLREHRPDDFLEYITNVRPQTQARAEEIQRREEIEYQTLLESGSWTPSVYPQKRSKVKETILRLKFQRLQERLKL